MQKMELPFVGMESDSGAYASLHQSILAAKKAVEIAESKLSCQFVNLFFKDRPYLAYIEFNCDYSYDDNGESNLHLQAHFGFEDGSNTEGDPPCGVVFDPSDQFRHGQQMEARRTSLNNDLDWSFYSRELEILDRLRVARGEVFSKIGPKLLGKENYLEWAALCEAKEISEAASIGKKEKSKPGL